MEDLKTAAWMLRYGARSLAHNLRHLPEERAHWKPEPGVKSPLAIATEVLGALNMYRPIFAGPEYPASLPPLRKPETLADAAERVVAAADDYAALLEAAGPELNRPQEMPFGATFRAYRAVCFPLLDLFNHHGQILYIQSLLGDREMHWDDAAIAEEFIWDPDAAAGS